MDREVVGITGEREPYVKSLLQIAEMRGRPKAVPAPLFLRERHLVHRVALMLKEVKMSKSRLAFSLILVAAVLFWTSSLAVGWFPLNAPPAVQAVVQEQAQPPAKPAREPIRVGGNVQESKLISKVEPVYPEEAKAARVSGVVILQVTVNEKGEVYDVRVLRGHPLLDEASVDAVKQWRYSPTYLNGEPVPIIATVTVIFSMGPSSSLGIDESGNLRDRRTNLQGEALLQKLRESKGPVLITPHPAVPFQVLEATLRNLQKQGVTNLELYGIYRFWEGRLFYDVSIRSSVTPGTQRILPPEIALDSERLAALARGSRNVEGIPRAADGQKPLIYRLYMNEVGEILSLEQLRGPKLPEVEAELQRTRVIAPGRRGAEPVPVAFAVEIVVDK